MRHLPERPNLEQVRHQAKDLLRAAREGDPLASAHLASISDKPTLSSAQVAVARSYGFASWAKLKLEIERRDILNNRDLHRLREMLTEQPDQAVDRMRSWCDVEQVGPVGYMAMLSFNAGRLGLPRDLPGTGEVVRLLLRAGAPVEGYPGDKEPPLVTAASYGDAAVARALIDAGADVNARSAPDSGGVPGGTALRHAAVFGMTDVVDVLIEAGAEIESVEMAAAAGDVSAWPLERASMQSRIRALVMAADHQRLQVIDQLVEAGTPVNEPDAEWGRHPLRTAAQHGRPHSVRRLLRHGADPGLRDEHGLTALDLCQPGKRYLDGLGHEEVDAILRPLTR